MPLELLPLEEADLWAYRTIFAEAFENTLMAVMFPNGYTEEDKTIDIEFQAREWLDHPEEVKLMKVVDTDLPDNDSCRKIVGVSKWKFYPNGTTEEKFKEGDDALLKRTWPPNADVQMFQAFIGAVRATNREILGLEPYAALGVLATRPTCHRRGVGAMHMRWGVAEADRVRIHQCISQPRFTPRNTDM